MRIKTSGVLAVLPAFFSLAPIAKSQVEATANQKPGIQPSFFDEAVAPGDDFYRFANGTWLKNNSVPSDKSSVGSFSGIADEVRERLKVIVEDCAAKADDGGADSDEGKVGAFYRSFMNVAEIESRGITPIAADLNRIASIRNLADLTEVTAFLATRGVAVVRSRATIDDRDATRHVVAVYQGGTSLPDRDYYLADTERFRKIRSELQDHIGRMLALVDEPEAATRAAEILAFETEVARLQWTRVESRDAIKRYNPHTLAELSELAPAFGWRQYFTALDYADAPLFLVAQPSFFAGWSKLLAATEITTLRAYLKWKLVRGFADFLPKRFIDEDFAFSGRVLGGREELLPRWKRGTQATERALGEVLGRIYVGLHFPPEAKRRMEKLVANLTRAYEASIRELEWMSEATKLRALEKLAKFRPKIGYPSRWKDYSALAIAPDDLLDNVRRAAAHRHAQNAAKLGQPIDREEWGMTPQTVNAYYNPNRNEIVFPAAILQPPFFDLDADDAVNYGGIGAVIGHEIGHGFDDQGSRYDGDGNLQSWWTDEDRAQFETRTRQLIKQYFAYEALPGQKVNGALTIGENIGDLGGATIAYRAYRMSHEAPPVIDGLTGDQRFFLSYAQIWRRNYRERDLIRRLKSDPHSPSEFRCNGIVRNVPEWYAAFGVDESHALYLLPDQRVKIW